MIADFDDNPKQNVGTTVLRNGTHLPTDPHALESDAPKSSYFRTLMAGMDAWEVWDAMNNAERLEVIFTHSNPLQWLEREELIVLAYFRSTPPGTWAQIRLRYRAIGGNPNDLERAVDQLLIEHPEHAAPQAPAAGERSRFQTISAAALYTKLIPPQAFIVQSLLPPGATLFTGRGKDGKSLLVWNLCVAIATGGKALGRYDVLQGEVLYLALEDGERRAQQRLIDQMALANMDAPPEHLELVLWDAPRMGEGFEAALTTWLDEHATARLVVVDILEKIRAKRSRNGSVYADDYEAVAPMQRIAQERGVAVLIVHHSNKLTRQDYRDTASGSMGLIGACDTFWSLHRVAGEPDAALRIIGRDVEAQDLALRFDAGFWTVLGDVETVTMNARHQGVLEALIAEGRPLTPSMLSEMLDIKPSTMRSDLRRLHQKGFVLNLGNGHYIPRLPKETE